MADAATSQAYFTNQYNTVLENLQAGNQQVVMSNHGELSQDEVNSFAYDVEQKMTELGVKRGVVKRMFSIIIEALQNIRLHGGKDGSGLQDSYVVVGGQDNSYKLYTANIINNEVKGKVEEKLKKVNTLDRAGLKEFYMQTLTDGERSSKGGAGLGFITMAMKSKNKLDYEFVEQESGKYYFSVVTTVDLAGKEE